MRVTRNDAKRVVNILGLRFLGLGHIIFKGLRIDGFDLIISMGCGLTVWAKIFSKACKLTACMNLLSKGCGFTIWSQLLSQAFGLTISTELFSRGYGLAVWTNMFSKGHCMTVWTSLFSRRQFGPKHSLSKGCGSTVWIKYSTGLQLHGLDHITFQRLQFEGLVQIIFKGLQFDGLDVIIFKGLAVWRFGPNVTYLPPAVVGRFLKLSDVFAAGHDVQTARTISNSRRIARIGSILTICWQNYSCRPNSCFRKIFRAVVFAVVDRRCRRCSNIFRCLKAQLKLNWVDKRPETRLVLAWFSIRLAIIWFAP